jgi:hypothetical protein
MKNVERVLLQNGFTYCDSREKIVLFKKKFKKINRNDFLQYLSIVHRLRVTN